MNINIRTIFPSFQTFSIDPNLFIVYNLKSAIIKFYFTPSYTWFGAVNILDNHSDLKLRS